MTSMFVFGVKDSANLPLRAEILTGTVMFLHTGWAAAMLDSNPATVRMLNFIVGEYAMEETTIYPDRGGNGVCCCCIIRRRTREERISPEHGIQRINIPRCSILIDG